MVAAARRRLSPGSLAPRCPAVPHPGMLAPAPGNFGRLSLSPPWCYLDPTALPNPPVLSFTTGPWGSSPGCLLRRCPLVLSRSPAAKGGEKFCPVQSRDRTAVLLKLFSIRSVRHGGERAAGSGVKLITVQKHTVIITDGTNKTTPFHQRSILSVDATQKTCSRAAPPRLSIRCNFIAHHSGSHLFSLHCCFHTITD